MNANRFDILIHAQPWQLLPFSAEEIVERVAGDLGASGLTLSVKADESQDAVALAPDDQITAVRLQAGAMFHPTSNQYASTRLRPQVSPTIKSRQLVNKIADLCHSQSLRFRLRLSALRDAGLAGKYPDVASSNVLSLTSATHLCPGNPDVVELVRCQILDLAAQFEPDGIELEYIASPDRFESFSERCLLPARPGPVESALLAICFCPSCRQQAILADIEPAMALRSVQVYLKRWLEKETLRPGTINDLLADNEILNAYVARQRDALMAAIQIWTKAAPNLSLVISQDRPCLPWNPSLEQIKAVAPRLTLPITLQNSPDHAVHSDEGIENGSSVEIAIDANSPSFATGPDIVRCLGDLARRNIGGVVVENGLNITPSRQAFLRQAIRTARRERLIQD